MRVFKFQPLKGPSFRRLLIILEKGKIYFSLPSQLNDPFEYASRLDFGSVPLSEKLDIWHDEPEYKDLLKWGSAAQREWALGQIESSILSSTLRETSTTGVFCTSKGWHNLVLWSHYADAHGGIAIEFDTAQSKSLLKPFPVKYTNRTTVFPAYDNIPREEMLRGLSTKFSDWSYEKEVRFFGRPGTHSVGRKSIKSITFGVNALNLHQRRVAQIFNFVKRKLPWCSLFVAQRKEEDYKLRRHLLRRHRGYWTFR